jgi:hypothetical protein
MNTEFKIYGGTKPNGDYCILGICQDAEYKVQDYFVPGTTDIEQMGVIQIVGDTHLLPESIDMTG